MTRVIKTNPGIGDSLWVLQKLINSGEKFRFQINDAHPRRGKQIFDLLPQVAESCEYVPNLPYSVIGPRNIQRANNRWKTIRARDFYLSANEHLEAGRRIEEFLTDLDTSFELPFQTQEWAPEVVKDFGEGIYIGIYASAYSTTRAWGFWQETEWLKMILLISSLIPDATFVHIGAEWDLQLSKNLQRLMISHRLKQVSTIGKPLGYVLEVMKRLNYGLYFPSGLGILSGLLRRPSIMFYPPHLTKMMGSWADPKLIEQGGFKECLFTTPEKIYQWLKSEYCIKDRLCAG